MTFEWNQERAAFNNALRGVSFEEAKEVFNDPHALAYPDDLQSFDRERFVIIGHSTQQLLLIVYAEPSEDVIRIVSAAGKQERIRNAMNKVNENEKPDTTFKYYVVEENDDEVFIEVTPEEYAREIAAGIRPDETLQPGRHRFIRGGFLKRHPNFDPSKVEIKYTVTLSFLPEIYEYFKQQAALGEGASCSEVMEKYLIGVWEIETKKSDDAQKIDP